MRIKASYQENEFLPELNGNPLTEALMFQDRDELIDALTYVPSYPTNFKQAPQYAKEFILKKLKTTHIPQPILSDLYSTITTLILERYASYHPMSAEHRRKLLQLSDLDTKVGTDEDDKALRLIGSTTAPSVLTDGQSGSGKTTMIRNTLATIPQVVVHNSYRGQRFRQDQLVWISMDLPTNASPKALALNFFHAVDEALGCTNYHGAWSKKERATVESHQNAMRLVAETHHLGIIHIDEIQFMLKYASSKDSPSLTVIEGLFNKLGIPVVLSTTTQGLALFDTANGENQFVDMTTTRRMLSERQYSCKLHKANSEFFNQLFDALFPPELCTEGRFPSEDFRRKFHHYSLGLPFMMVRLAHLHHETTYRRIARKPDNKGTIKTDCIESLEKTYERQFKLIHPALENLRAGNELEYERKVLDRGGLKKFFDTAKESEHKKKVKKLSNTEPKSDSLVEKQEHKVEVKKRQNKNIEDEFADFATGIEE